MKTTRLRARQLEIATSLYSPAKGLRAIHCLEKNPRSRIRGVGSGVKYGAEQEWSRLEWSRITPEWMGFDNKLGTTLASARALCLDLLLCVQLHISGGLNCCQEFRRGEV